MPQIRLATVQPVPPVPVELPTGTPLQLPRLQLRCLTRVPGFLAPRDAVIDTGSPWTWMPEAIWSRFQHGIDFEWLPFPPGYTPPLAHVAGWTAPFRMARMLMPLVLQDLTTELARTGVIVQLASGNPPAQTRGRSPAYLVIGLWGGVLDGTKIAITPNPQTGGVDGVLEF